MNPSIVIVARDRGACAAGVGQLADAMAALPPTDQRHLMLYSLEELSRRLRAGGRG